MQTHVENVILNLTLNVIKNAKEVAIMSDIKKTPEETTETKEKEIVPTKTDTTICAPEFPSGCMDLEH